MRLAPIYPGEGKVVFLCMAVNLLVVAGIMYGRNARDSLFLNSFGVQYLPHMYFANAVVLVVCSLFYTSLVDRIDRGKFLGGVSILFIGILIASRAILAGQPRWFYPVLYILAQAIWNFSLLQFWTFLGDLFDTRQAKRLFPLIAVGSLLGMIGVGLTSRPAVRALGTENILLVWAGLIASALVLGAIIFRKYRHAQSPPPASDRASLPPPRKSSEWQKFKEGAARLRQEPLLRNMALITFLLWTVFTVVDFNFNSVMKQTYPDKDVLTAFFGTFRGIAGFLCLVIQLFLTSALISRLGVGATIAFHPAFLTLSTLWMTLSFGYTSVYAAKMGDHVLLYTFQDSSFQLLYSPIPLDQRARIRGFIDGYIKPLSMAAAGVLLLLGTRYLSLRQIAMIGFVLALAWLAISATTKKGYVKALLRNLEADSPAVRQAAATALAKLKDPSSVALFSATLRSTPADRLVPAMQLLDTLDVGEAHTTLVELLAHPDARVRATAVSSLGRRGVSGHLDSLLPLLNDPDSRVRANVIEALATAKDPSLVEKLRPMLQDPSTRARVNTVLTLAAIQGVDSAVDSFHLIQELARGDVKARSTATYALGRLPFEESLNILIELLDDPHPEIRCEAAQALGRVGSPRVIPNLIEALGGPPELRHHARRSLAAILRNCGTPCIDELIGIARSSDRAEIRSELADVLGRLKDKRVIDSLLELLKDPEWRVRWKVLRSFERLARDGPLPEHARQGLFDYARGELARFRHSLECSHALLPSPQTPPERLLALALEEDRHNIQERVFRMLGVLCGREAMREIFEELQSDDPRLRADALEALDTLAPKAIGRELLALLEPAPTSRPAAAQPVAPLLDSLAAHTKPWVRACTSYYLGHHDHPRREEILKALLTDRAPLVRETSLWSGWRALGESWRAQLDEASASPDESLREAARKIRIRHSVGNCEALPSLRRGETMLLSIEKAVFLKSAPLFAALEGEELAALADIALEVTYEPGEVIFEENQEPHHLYLVVTGRVEVFRRVNSHERALAHLGEKECFGEMAILDEQPRSASVRAVEPTTALKIDRDSFHELIMERPHIAFAIFKILSGRLRHQNLEADHIPAAFSSGHYA
jgi:HEAT repeat protein